MENKRYEVDSFKLFSESHLWQLNRDFYQNAGIGAFSSGLVPHQMTSNSMVGKTYAEIILGFLTDLANKGNTTDTVYILELGAGHGRLTFNMIKHLEKLTALLDVKLPPYCFILSDIVEENILFYKNHPQLQTYFQQGILDYSFFDAIDGKSLHLKYADVKIKADDLKQPMIAVANYFFDSIPNDVFVVKNQEISACSIALHSEKNPAETESAELIKSLELTYRNDPVEKSFYKNDIYNEILEDYKYLLKDTYLFFPQKGLECLNNLHELSSKGLMMLSMDKGFLDIHDLDKKEEPDVIKHGSFSLWVNFHALGAFCKKKGGKILFPSFSTFHLQIGCLMFLPDGDTYQYTNAAYQRFVNDFGPDDLNSLKKIAYYNISKLKFVELIGLIRLNAYDSSFFVKVLPYLRKMSQFISFNERNRLAQTLHAVWGCYFNINEPNNLAFELGGFFYDLGFHAEALVYFEHSINLYGQKPDIYYNKILCYYQLRQDDLFTKTLKEAKELYPDNTTFAKLDELDLAAV